MKRFFTCCLALLLVSCGYHLGGLKSRHLEGMNTFCVDMFANHTVYADVSMQMTTALADQLERDGSFRMASRSNADFRVEGEVTSVRAASLRPNAENTYLSAEIDLRIYVKFRVISSTSGKLLMSGEVSADAGYFNDAGNVQTARASALSYATRRAAEMIVQYMTMP